MHPLHLVKITEAGCRMISGVLAGSRQAAATAARALLR